MTIQQVLLSNTFNEFRQTVNEITNTVNSITGGGTGSDLSANTVTIDSLSQGRMLYVGVDGLLIDSSNLTYDGTKLSILNTTTSSATNTGALVVAGGVGIGEKLNVAGIAHFGANVEIDGNLVVTGNTTQLDFVNFIVTDPIILLASNNTSNTVDIGFTGHYNEGSNTQHTGLIRDFTDDRWYLFKDYELEPQTSNVIDPSHPTFHLDDLTLNDITSNNITANGATFSSDVTLNANVTLGDSSSDTITLNSGNLSLNNNLNIDSGKFFLDQSNTKFGINTATPRSSLDINTTDGLYIPVGTTAERPATPQQGVVRWNTDLNKAEVYNGTAWTALGGTSSSAKMYFFSSF